MPSDASAAMSSACAPSSVHYVRAGRAAAIGLVFNTALCAAKSLAGWFGGSFALLCDAANNLADVGLSAGLWLGMRLAARPPDANHGYGHGRIESELGRLVGLLVLVAAGGIAVAAANRLDDRHGSPHAAVLATAAAALLVKEGLYRYQRRVGRELNSSAVLADALNHRTDAAATGAVLLGSFAVGFGGPAWAPADDLAALAVAACMALAGSRVIVRASRELMDEMPPPEMLENVRGIAREVPGVLGVEKVLGRKMGLHYLLDLHVEVDPSTTVEVSHEVARQVRRTIVARRTDVSNVTIHVEPYLSR